MAAPFVPGRVLDVCVLAEVGHGERAHVSDDLSEREVQARLAVADKSCVRDHREGGGGSVREFKVDDLRNGWSEILRLRAVKGCGFYLIVADVVVTLVHALSVTRCTQHLVNTFDVRDAVNDRADRPALVTLLHTLEIDYTALRMRLDIGAS